MNNGAQEPQRLPRTPASPSSRPSSPRVPILSSAACSRQLSQGPWAAWAGSSLRLRARLVVGFLLVGFELGKAFGEAARLASPSRHDRRLPRKTSQRRPSTHARASLPLAPARGCLRRGLRIAPTRVGSLAAAEGAERIPNGPRKILAAEALAKVLEVSPDSVPASRARKGSQPHLLPSLGVGEVF